MIIFLGILCGALLVLLGMSLWANIRFVGMLSDIEDRSEKALDKLDYFYREIGKVLQIPLFHDDPVIRSTLELIKGAHHAVLSIAGSLAAPVKREKNDDEE